MSAKIYIYPHAFVDLDLEVGYLRGQCDTFHVLRLVQARVVDNSLMYASELYQPPVLDFYP